MDRLSCATYAAPVQIMLALATLALAIPASANPSLAVRSSDTGVESRHDERLKPLFAAFSGLGSPGCAVGWEDGKGKIQSRVWGSADLEHGIAITPATVFEAGSVSKQFTAAAILMLVEQGKLALTDDIRRYLPELTQLGTIVTIDNLLTHTSGLRDWGSMAALGGWPRTERAHDNGDVLAIVARQQALNHAPGADWSYTNSGYNLLAMIVERASGQSLASYTRQRLFVPLGMTRTSWRDDFQRVVPGRAVAYERKAGEWRQEMPFEDAYGNGGLLTTIEDLLRWNRALGSGQLGKFVTEALVARTVLTDGRTVSYARGLVSSDYRGTAEISHSGATAGYRAWLGRWPQKSLSVALLCNAPDPRLGKLPRQIADAVIFGSPAAPSPAEASNRLEGLWVDERRGVPITIAQTASGLTADGAPLLAEGGLQTRAGKIIASSQDELTILGDGQPRRFKRTVPWHPTASDLFGLVGRYASTEADTEFDITVDGNSLILRNRARPSLVVRLEPVYFNAFAAQNILVRFVPSKSGTLALHVLDSRAWDVVFHPTGEKNR